MKPELIALWQNQLIDEGLPFDGEDYGLYLLDAYEVPEETKIKFDELENMIVEMLKDESNEQ